jgi:lysozyme
MTSPHLAGDIERDEGIELVAYPDPLTRASPWTIGCGHCGPDVHPGLTWTEQQAEDALKADIAKAIAGLDHAIPWWRKLCDVRQDVLVNMAFNMGVEGLLKFRHMLTAAEDGHYYAAAAEMRASQWAKQLPKRSHRLAAQMATGERQP